MRTRRTASFPVAALILAGCGARWVSFDAPDSASRADAVDTAAREASSPPQRCTTHADCTRDAQCLSIFPGGFCSRRCTNDGACGSDGICEPNQGICLPHCTSGGRQCDSYGAACAFPDVTDRSRGLCIPSCFPTGTTAPAGSVPMCAAALPCDPNRGSCNATSSAGGQVGDPCIADSDCATGRCITERDRTMQPSGFLDGMCMAIGRRPAMSIVGGLLPRENCPMGAVIFDDGLGLVGDVAPCLKECLADAECRAGYRCQHRTASGTAMNGVCVPIDCTEPGRSCPAGTRCTTNASGGHVCTH